MRKFQSGARCARLASVTPLLTLGLLCTGPAQAADTATASAGVLEEVVVTARKREENLQDTPISIAAFSGEALEARNVSTIADLGRFVPNMSFETSANISGSSAASTVFIRGVGQTDFNLTIDPGVGLYVDGVYVSRSIGALLDVVDLERVEVLRGPQGTLFGKNTIGGAVVVTTQPPGRDFAAAVDVTAGSRKRFDVRGTVNLPLGDTLALRLTGATQSQDGYVDRLSDGGTMGNRHSQSGRAVLRFEPSDRMSFDLSFDGTRKREEAVPSTIVAINPAGQFASFWNFAVNGATCFTPPDGFPIPASPECYGPHWQTGHKLSTWSGGGNYSDLDLWGVGFTARVGLGPVDLKWISSYRHMNSRFTVDLDGSPLPVDESSNTYTQKQWSQELQLSGTSFDDRLKWVAGLYYLNEKGEDRNALEFSIADFISGGAVENDSYAVFAQGTWRLAERVNLTLGARFSDETKRFLPDQYIVNDRTGGSLLVLSRCFIREVPVLPPDPGCIADPVLNPDGNRILPHVETSTNTRQTTPSIALDFRLAPDVLTYMSFSKGFKSGGFTQRIFPPEPVTPSFKPEFVKSYELGLKSELFDRRLRWNSAIFRTDYSDMQLIVNEGIAPKVRNAGKARIQGFETELEAVPFERLRLTAALGYTDAEYDSVPASAAPVTTDSKLPNTPKWTGSLGAHVDLWRASAGTLELQTDYAYKGAAYKDAINSPSLYQAGYSLLSASLTFRSDAAWSVTVGGTNLTDKTYLLSGYQSLDSLGASTAAYARPREWYARLRYDFAAH